MIRRQHPSHNPIARALIVRDWSSIGVDAQIQALIGSDARMLCNGAGRMFFVALGAAQTEGIHHDDPDVRIIRGAVNEVYDIADLTDIPDRSRIPIQSGLEAVKRLAGRVKVRALADSYLDLMDRLRRGDVRISDFDGLIQHERETT